MDKNSLMPYRSPLYQITAIEKSSWEFSGFILFARGPRACIDPPTKWLSSLDILGAHCWPPRHTTPSALLDAAYPTSE